MLNKESRYQAQFVDGRVGIGNADHHCPIGTILCVAPGGVVERGEKLCSWPPFKQVFSPLDGILHWSASAEKCAREETDVTGLKSWMMVERSTLTIVGQDQSLRLQLPAMTEVRVPNGADVRRGDRIAVNLEHDPALLFREDDAVGIEDVIARTEAQLPDASNEFVRAELVADLVAVLSEVETIHSTVRRLKQPTRELLAEVIGAYRTRGVEEVYVRRLVYAYDYMAQPRANERFERGLARLADLASQNTP